eukprot:gene21062-biopygen14629
MASPEELLGLINGLAGAIRDQHHASREVTGTTQQQISDLSHAVNELSASVRSRGDQQSQAALRLPPLTLPEFTGGELQIDRFCEQLSQVLSSSNTHAKFWLPYLKQQCQKDSRAFDIICSFELSNASRISHKTSSDEFLSLYDECLQLLRLQRGIPREQQIRNLLATYYSLHQNPDESVSNFAHRFMETPHSLQKLVPGIHCSPDGSQVELIHTFSIKLLPDIGKYLITREQPFTDLLAAVECAKRHESMMSSAPTKLPHTDVLYTAPPTAPPRRTPKTDANTHQVTKSAPLSAEKGNCQGTGVVKGP